MSDKIYIYSTLSNDQNYSIGDDDNTVLIAGKANVSNKNFLTPRGMSTTISEGTFEQLQRNIIFQAHSKNGFVTASVKKMDVDEVAADMEQKDNSAQGTVESMKKKDAKAAHVKG